MSRLDQQNLQMLKGKSQAWDWACTYIRRVAWIKETCSQRSLCICSQDMPCADTGRVEIVLLYPDPAYQLWHPAHEWSHSVAQGEDSDSVVCENGCVVILCTCTQSAHVNKDDTTTADSKLQ